MSTTSENLNAAEMGERCESAISNLHIHTPVPAAADVELDDDGRPKRTGTVLTACAHIITAVIGSGVLSLAWCMAQLGWVAGIFAIINFSLLTFFTSSLLTDCYRTPDPVTGKRNHSYREAVRANLGGTMHMLCALTQYVNISGVAIGYLITASISTVAVQKSNCFHKNGHHDDPSACVFSNNPSLIALGLLEIILSQIPNIHKLTWLSTVSAFMSFSYAIIGVGLSISKIVSGDTGKTSVGGVEIGPDYTESQKIWNVFIAIGNIAFAYAYSIILIEIQDTLRAPEENKQMKKATFIGVSTTTVFYLSCGCVGYAAFGNAAPGNLLTGFYEPFWLIDLVNVCLAIHIVGAFQVFCQPLFAAVEAWASMRMSTSQFVTREYPIKIRGTFKYNISLFRLVWRSGFVILATVLAMAMPFFNDILGLLGALGYWPLTIYFPIKMHIAQKNIRRFTVRWFWLQLIIFSCLVVALAAICGSTRGIHKAFQEAKPFNSKQ